MADFKLINAKVNAANVKYKIDANAKSKEVTEDKIIN